VKEAVTFYDWAKTRIQQGYNKNLKEKEDKDNVQEEISDLKEAFKKKTQSLDAKNQEINEGFDKINEQINILTDKVNLLVDSDKDDIKAFITREHHYFCYQKQWIDTYSLDCIERRFVHYRQENGNSFVEDLMKELRALPKQPS
jgi:phosphoenolpyruvate-protein kinase (PTS system EI component)